MSSPPFFSRSFLLMLMFTAVAREEAEAQGRKDVNYDEAKVGTYTLPDPLTMANGQPVTSVQQWQEKRRPEILELFRSQVFGRSPARMAETRFEVGKVDPEALSGKAIRREITVYLTGQPEGPMMSILLYLPNGATKPSPAFVSPNFDGNHTVSTDPAISLPKGWVAGTDSHRAAESARGSGASRWPVEAIVGRGYALATVYYGDVEPDHPEGWKAGLRGALSPQGAATVWKGDEWGAIGAWSYGLSRVLDYLQTEPQIDPQQVAVLGHSRLGKTALWAGASDERFAMVISNDSGEGGAALARRNFGETTAIINGAFPHWFCGNYKAYNGAAEKLPIDAHELIALIAPRPVYVASASKDQWADPKGEFLAAQAAEPVYRLWGKGGLGVSEQPQPGQPVGDCIGYHLRSGEHDITAYDWEQYMNFADRHFGRK